MMGNMVFFLNHWWIDDFPDGKTPVKKKNTMFNQWIDWEIPSQWWICQDFSLLSFLNQTPQ